MTDLLDMLRGLPPLAWIKPWDVRDEDVPQVAKNLRAKSDAELVRMWQQAEHQRFANGTHDAARYLVTLAREGDTDALLDAAQAMGVDTLMMSSAADCKVFREVERRVYRALRGETSPQVWFDAFDGWVPARDLGDAPERSPQRVCPVRGCRDVPPGLERYCARHLRRRRGARPAESGGGPMSETTEPLCRVCGVDDAIERASCKCGVWFGKINWDDPNPHEPDCERGVGWYDRIPLCGVAPTRDELREIGWAVVSFFAAAIQSSAARDRRVGA